jgi:hypothetical protein
MWGTEMYISIKELPEELTDVVNNAVEEKIKEYCVENKNVMEKYGQKWSNKQILEPQLWVYIPDFMNSGSDGKIEYELDIFFTDAEDETLFDTVRIDIGLHTTEELRNVIVEAFRGIIK